MQGERKYRGIPDKRGRVITHTERGDGYKPANKFRKSSEMKSLRLLPSSKGKIDSLLISLPGLLHYKDEYLAVIGELMTKLKGVKFILVVENNKDEKLEIASSLQFLEDIAKENGADVTILKSEDEVEDVFSIWSQDAFLVAQSESGDTFFIKPFPKREDRAGDDSVAEVVAQNLSDKILDFPGILEGGNVLVAEKFILVGADEAIYDIENEKEDIPVGLSFFETFEQKMKEHIKDGRPIIPVYSSAKKYQSDVNVEKEDLKRSITKDITTIYTDNTRDLSVAYSDGGQYHHTIYNWRGKRQAIYHIDLFMTLLGEDECGNYRIMIGDPVAGYETTEGIKRDDRINDFLHYQLEDATSRINECIGRLTSNFAKLGIPLKIIRNPLPLTYQKIGRRKRLWYWASYNNALVEINGKESRAFLPSYGTEKDKDNQHWAGLKKYDDENHKIFQREGFKTCKFSNNFHFLAERSGALHCIVKCLSRS